MLYKIFKRFLINIVRVRSPSIILKSLLIVCVLAFRDRPGFWSYCLVNYAGGGCADDACWFVHAGDGAELAAAAARVTRAGVLAAVQMRHRGVHRGSARVRRVSLAASAARPLVAPRRARELALAHCCIHWRPVGRSESALSAPAPAAARHHRTAQLLPAVLRLLTHSFHVGSQMLRLSNVRIDLLHH